MEKLLLIDGHSMLNRAFYGVPMLTDAEGNPTNAIYGFLNILLKILAEEKPQYLTVAFDVHAPTFRHQTYEAYKGTRNKMPTELVQQVPMMKEVLRAMGIAIAEKEGFEADDVLGTLSRQAEEAGLEAVILSGDRDLLQLATEQVMIRIPKTSKGVTTIYNYHAKEVEAEFGVTPKEFIDVKALMGDASDNIPGIPGVGIKTAEKIIQAFHSIEEAYAHLDEIKPAKAQNSLREHYDNAVLSKDLATIRLDAPVQFEPDTAVLGNIFTEEAYRLFKQYEFRNLLGKFDAELTGAGARKNEIEILRCAVAAKECIRQLASEKSSGYAVQTDGSHIYGLAFAFDSGSIYIPISEEISEETLKQYLQVYLESVKSAAVWGLKPSLKLCEIPESARIMDVKLAAYLLDPLKSTYPYDSLASEYAELILSSSGELFGKKLPPADQMEEAKAAEYYTNQAICAWKTAEPLQQRLKAEGMEPLYYEIELPLVYTLAKMELEGIRIHKEALAEYGARLETQIRELEQKIYTAAGEEFNLNSPKQLGGILFEKMGIPGGKKTKTGYSTAADVLEKLSAEVPFVKDILEYRQLTKLKSTYADTLGGFADEHGRIHSNFSQTTAATGRLSSTDPNLQNIPIRMELGREIRKVFVPDEGNVFIDADYSQIELRVLAAMSKDPKLIEAYKQDKDIHRITASQVFHVPFEEVTSLQRRSAKAVNFGIVYGISSFGLSQGLDVSRQEAAEYIERYFHTYPKIKEFLDQLVDDAKKTGYAVTLYGRKRPIPELSASNFMQRSFGERVAMNSPIQGTAADIIKIAMNRVRQRLEKEALRSRMILQVHDELLIEAPQDEADYVAKLLEEEMCRAAELPVALEVDVHRGSSWYDAK